MSPLERTAGFETTELVLSGDKQMNQKVRRFNEWNEGQPVSFERITAFMLHLKNDVGLLPATQKTYRHALKQSTLATFPKVARDVAFVARLNDAFAKLRIPESKHLISEDEILSVPEVKILIKSLEGDGKKRLSLMAQFLFSSGARIQETLAIRPRDVKIKSGMAIIRISENKNKREYFKRIPAPLYQAIVKEFKSKTFLFQSPRGKQYSTTNFYIQLNKAGQKYLGRNDVGCHLFRKSSASALILNLKQSTNLVQNFLGHSSIKTTSQYYIFNSFTNQHAENLNSLLEVSQ